MSTGSESIFLENHERRGIKDLNRTAEALSGFSTFEREFYQLIHIIHSKKPCTMWIKLWMYRAPFGFSFERGCVKLSTAKAAQ